MDNFDSGLDPSKLLYLKHGFFFGGHDAKDATDEKLNPGQNLRPALQITQTLSHRTKRSAWGTSNLH